MLTKGGVGGGGGGIKFNHLIEVMVKGMHQNYVCNLVPLTTCNGLLDFIFFNLMAKILKTMLKKKTCL
jgi:hypothetical protein